MDQQDRRTPPRASSIPHAATSGGGSSSAMLLGLSSSPATSPHRRRFSPSLYPAPSPGRLASGSGSASRFGQIPPLAAPGGRQRGTHALPTPFLSELASIRRMGASGDLDARPTSHHRDVSAARRALIGLQQQAWAPSSTPTMSPLPSNRFSGFPASAFWPQQRRQVLSPSSSSGAPPPALQQQQTTNQPSSSTDLLAPLPSGTGIFSGLARPASSNSSFTDNLTPLPEDELTTMFCSSSLSSSAHLVAPATVSHTMTTVYSHAQSSSDSELLPFPPSLEMQSQDQQTPSWQWQSSGNYGVTCSEFEAPILDVSVAVAPRFQIKEEPMDAAPCGQQQPELISLDDDEDDAVSALFCNRPNRQVSRRAFTASSPPPY